MRNVVMITFDSLRADHCGYVGYNRDTTPTLDKMANEGISFENAISPASRTNPSMAGIFTGESLVVRNKVSQNEHSSRHLERHETLAELLSERGYSTGAFCPNAYSSRYYGFDKGFDKFEDFLFQNDVYQRIFRSHLSDSNFVTWVRNIRNFIRRQEAFKTWDTYIDQMEDWVEKQQEPFFLWAFSLDTHFPYITPRKHRKWGSSIDMYYYNWRCNQLIDKMDIDLTEKERKKMLNIYDDSIRFGDILIRELKERLSEYDPIFVIFGDHGEAFNEHGLYGHFYPTLYEENIHVPLVIWDNNGNQQTVKKPTSLLDLPDMIINGLEGDIKSITRESVTAIDFDGRHDRHVLTTRGSEWKYILEVDGSRRSEEYYHLATDPQESENLLGEEEVPSELEYRTLRQFNTESEILKIRKGVENSHTNIEKLD